MRFDITWVETIDSTNSFLRAREARLPVSPTPVVAARRQLSGRGRETRYWLSEPYKDLACSLLIPTQAPLPQLPSVTMAVALAIRSLLSERYGVAAGVKWPNDVMVAGKKICGILSEYLPNNHSKTIDTGAAPCHRMLVGIGLNVGMSQATLLRIDQPATSMAEETGGAHNIDTVLEALLTTLPPWLARWEAGGFAALRSEWLRHEQRLHTQIQVKQGATVRHGVLEDFGEHGELLLRIANGAQVACVHGDIFPDAKPDTAS